MYFLDSNTCIYFLNGTYTSIRDKLLSMSLNEIVIPSIVKAELILGAYKSQHSKTNLENVEKFLQPFEVISFNDQMTYVYASIRFKTEKVGKIVGPNDLFIASITKFHEGILVTHNVNEFKRIEGLIIEDWVKG